MERNDYLIKKKFYSYLLPGILMVVAMQLGNVVDGIIVGNILGSTALAAISLSTPVLYFLQLPAFILAAGGSAQASVYLGRREIKKASEIFSVSIVTGTIISLVYCLAAPILSHPLAHMLAGTPQLESLLYPYILVNMLGIPILTMAVECSYFFNVDNNLILGTIMFIIANVVNLVLDYVFLKFTSMGIYGAALSTILGYIVGLGLVIPYIFSKKRMLSFILVNIWKNKSCILEVIKAGASSGMFFIMLSLKDFILNSCVVRILGQHAMEIYSVCTNSVFVIELFAGGVVGLVQTICGILYGEKDYYGIRRVIRRVVFFCITLTGVLTILFMAFPQVVAGLFGYNNAEYMNVMLTCIRLFSLSFVFYALNKFFQVYYQTILMPVPALLDTVLQGSIVLIPVTFLLLYAKGIYGVCMGAACSELLTLLILCSFVLLRQKHGKLPQKGLLLIPEKDNENYADVTIRGEVTEGTDISQKLIECCVEHGIDRKKANLIGIAAEEIVVNISRYGYKKRKRNYIDVSLSKTDEKLMLRIRDDGVPFDPTRYHPAEEEEFEIHGISLIKKTAVQLSYVRVLNMNNTIIEIDI